MLDKQTISVVVPVFNEIEVLPELIKRLEKVIIEQLQPYSIEVVFVNDGSSDGSRKFLSQLVSTDSKYRVINLSRNFGHQAAVMAGLRAAKGSAIVITDADLQDPPEVIPRLIEEWRNGAEVVHAVRKTRLSESVVKQTTAKLFYRLINSLSEIPLQLDAGDFRLIDRKVVEVVSALPERSLYLRGLFCWVGFKQASVQFDRDARFAGTSKYSYRRMVGLGVDAVLSFSEKPLKYIVRTSIAIVVLSIAMSVWLITSWVLGLGNPARGWLSLINLVLFLGGVQLLVLGVIGSYVGRIYRETKSRPIYVEDTE